MEPVRFRTTCPQISITSTPTELSQHHPRQETMDKLPQELIDKIIDSIDRTRPGGYSALRSCSRVCRSWQRQAQKVLFSSVQIISWDQLRRWDRNVPLADSEVPSYVRRLRWGVWPARIACSDPFLENTFPGRFATFCNIENLHVSTLSLRFLKIKHTFGHLGPSLRSLDMDHLITDPEKWCFLVSLLPNLRRITTLAVTMLEREGGPSPNHPHSFDFTGHIAAYDDRTEQFFRCIAGLNPRFESLEVHALNDDLVDTLNLVLRSCSTTLTTISVMPLFPGMEGNLNQSQSVLFTANLI